MRKTFTASMAVLHTWCGLIFGWVLFAVFLTGALTVFWMEIGDWGTPELFAKPQPARAETIERGMAYLAATAPQSKNWRLVLPNARDVAMGAAWEDDKDEMQKVVLNPATGQTVRNSEGGWFFIGFHYRLHMAGKDRLGLWLIGLASMAMLIACISGVIIHKRIFRDFFLLRLWSSRQRALTDLHNVVAVLPLPFHIMILATGLAISATTYMPAGLKALPTLPRKPPAREAAAAPHHKAPMTMAAMARPPMSKLIARVDREEAPAKVEYFYVVDPGTPKETVRFSLQRDNNAPTQSAQVTYETAKAEFKRLPQRKGATGVQFFMRGLHFAQFGGGLLLWLYFLGGLLGAAAIAAGTTLFVVKRSRRDLDPVMASWVKAASRINVAAIGGPILASLGFLWAMRLVPAQIPNRPALEINGFWWVFAAAAIHALARPPRQAWVEQLGAAALLCLGLPFLSLIDPGAPLPLTLARGQWSSAGVELTAIAFGFAFAGAAMLIQHRWTPVGEAAA